MTAEAPVSYPGMLHFRCGHGVTIAGDAVGPGVWMVVTDTERTQQGVSMEPENAITIAAALADSALRASGTQSALKIVGGAVETTLRQALQELAELRSGLAINDLGHAPERLVTVERQLRWLLGEG